MVLTHSRSTPDQCEHQEEQSRYFQPQDMQHVSNPADRDPACIVNRPNPSIFTGLTSGDAEQSAALSTEIAG